MRRPLLLAALALAACPGGDTRVFSASFVVGGSTRAIDDRTGGRVTCTVDADVGSAIDDKPSLTVAITASTDGERGPGLYFTVFDFRGEGAYLLGTDRGRALVFDSATLADCGRTDDTLCYTAVDGCTLQVTAWTLGDAGATGVRAGTATGTVTCDSLRNPTTRATVKLRDGSFTCRASDWTGARR